MKPQVRAQTRAARRAGWAAMCALTAAVGLAGCTAGAGLGEVVAEPAVSAPQAAAPLLNTASVLFPAHTMTLEAIEAQQAAFRSHVTTLDPAETRNVAAVTAVRSGPSDTSDVLTLLAPGDQVRVDGQVAHWFRVADGVGAGGYVSGLALDSGEEIPALADGAADDGSSDVAWRTTVANTGGAAEIDACVGGLTEYTPMSRDLGVPSYHMHSYCGGDPILTLQVGDVIEIDGVRYRVASTHDFPIYSSTEVMDGLHADAFVQTCDLVAAQSRVLGLARLGE